MTERKLTAKQMRFVEEYVIDMNASQAAIRAGYSKNRASEIGYQLLQKTTVQNAIKAKCEKISEKTEYTAENWRRDLLELKDRFMQKRVILDENGNAYKDEYGNNLVETSEPVAALRAMELLGKHMGLLIEKKQLDVNLNDRSDWLADALKDVKE